MLCVQLLLKEEGATRKVGKFLSEITQKCQKAICISYSAASGP
jgi:hypothetical protein